MMWALKRRGFSDQRIADLVSADESAVRAHRWSLNIRPVYKRVDTCAAEFSSSTAYMYSTYEEECEAAPSDRKKILVLGGGPIVSVRASSLITAVFTRCWRCGKTVTRP